MPNLVISSLRGGMNNSDPPIALADDQVSLAQNVEWVRSTLGERRRGALQIDIGSPFADCERIVWLHRHLPTNDPADAQLWALGINDTGPAAVLAYKDTSWHTVSMSDAMTIDGTSEYQVTGQTLHGKLFLAYNSAVDRLHVWDGTSLRRVGVGTPAAPTAADTGVGTFASTRYYRVRYTVQSGGTTLRRSEPSAVLTKAPSGTGTGLVVTKPTTISEGETHWELEASLNNADFYRIATTVVGTTTVTDSVAAGTGYAASGTLSEDSGDYTVPHSARLLIADEDRLLLFGAWETASLESSASWTPVFNATGVGNDERIPLDPVSVVNLDGYEGGKITAVSRATAGAIRVFKQSHTYSMIRTGIRTRAYEAVVVTKARGAVPGSVVEGVDNVGNPAVYFADPDVGPCVFAKGGIQRCGRDMVAIWQLINLDATVVCRALYYPPAQQVQWRFASGTATVPSFAMVLHPIEMRQTDTGELRRGWSYWTGDACEALAVCLFSDNIDDDTDRSQTLVPFLGVTGNGLIWQADTGDDDNGAEYDAQLTLKPYAPGQLQTQVEVTTAHLVAKAATGSSITLTAYPDFGLTEQKVSEPIDLAASARNETHVIRSLDRDNIGIADCRTVQFTITDTQTPNARWELSRLIIGFTGGQGA